MQNALRKATATNPYLDEFLLVNGETDRWEESGLFRDHRSGMVSRFAWAVPDEAAIKAIVTHGPVVEIGAGSGYWCYLIQQAGGDAVAYDVKPPNAPGNDYGHDREWFKVLPGGPEKLADHSDRSLFLCWPPYKSSMAADCLKAYRGKTVLYVGEGYGGCTGDDEFHTLLDKEFDCSESIRIPKWAGIHDDLTVWVRKTATKEG